MPDVNGQPFDPNFGPQAIDGFVVEDPASTIAGLGLKTLSDADAQALIAAVQAAITNAASNSSALDTVKQIASTLAPFLTLI